jgi:hypothetical protein
VGTGVAARFREVIGHANQDVQPEMLHATRVLARVSFRVVLSVSMFVMRVVVFVYAVRHHLMGRANQRTTSACALFPALNPTCRRHMQWGILERSGQGTKR